MPWNEAAFHIRQYRHADFSSLCEIDQACFSEAIAYTPEEIALGLIQPGAFALVAERGDQIIGFVLYHVRRRLGHIVTIDVLPGFRRMGVGSRFMELGEKRLRQSGANRIVLEVNTENDPAIRFYQQLGYGIKRRIAAYYQDGSDAYLMEKILS